MADFWLKTTNFLKLNVQFFDENKGRFQVKIRFTGTNCLYLFKIGQFQLKSAIFIKKWSFYLKNWSFTTKNSSYQAIFYPFLALVFSIKKWSGHFYQILTGGIRFC